MRRPLLLILGVVLAVPSLAAAPSKLLLVAHDLEDRPLSGCRFTYAGVESRPTSQAGATELDLPAGHETGRAVRILLLSGPKRAEDWFLVNPQVNIPGPGSSADMVLMRRSAFRQVAAEARDAPAVASQIAEERKRIIVEIAVRHGLTPEQLETAIASFAETRDPKDQGIADYLAGQYPEAEKLLERAAEKEALDLAETRRYLGASQYEQGKFHAAADSFGKAIALRGENGVLLKWLGRAFYKLARWNEAESLLRRALALDEKRYGPEHPEVAADLCYLAPVLYETNRLSEAEPLLRRALALDEKHYGPEHPEVATVLRSLAQLLQTTNRLSEAEPLLRRTLAIYEKRYGPERPEVATALINLAQLLQETSRLSEAEPLLRRALAIYEKSYGPEHPEVARDLNYLAQLLQETSRLSEAESLLRRALAIDEKNYGSEHPEVARDLNNLASLLQAISRLSEAEPLARRALAIDEKSYGPEHPEVARDLDTIANLLQEMSRLSEAEPLLRRALAINEKSYGPEHPDVATTLNNLAYLLQTMNRLSEAEPLARRALAIEEKSYGPEHLRVADALDTLACLLQASSRLSEAEPLMRRSLGIYFDFTRRMGHEPPSLREVQGHYASLLQAMGKPRAEVEAAIQSLRQPPR